MPLDLETAAEVPPGDPVRGLDHDPEGPGDPAGDEGQQAQEEQDAQAGDRGERADDPVAEVDVGAFQHAHVEHADDAAVEVGDRLIGRDVPGRDDEGPAEIGLPPLEDGLLDLPRNAGPHGPAPRDVHDVRRDAQVVLEQGHRADVVALVLLSLENDLLDLVDDRIVPVEEEAAGEHADRPSVRADDGRRRLEHHPVLLGRLLPDGGHGCRDEIEIGPGREVGPLLEELGPGDDLGAGRALSLEGPGDERVPGLVVPRDPGASGPDDDPALPVGQRQDVQPQVPADAVQADVDVVEPAGQDGLTDEIAVGAEADGVPYGGQPLVVDHPGRGEVVPDLGFGQGDDRPVLETRPDEEGDEPADGDDDEEAQDELAPQGKVVESLVQSPP